jgi:hypothetical protein
LPIETSDFGVLETHVGGLGILHSISDGVMALRPDGPRPVACNFGPFSRQCRRGLRIRNRRSRLDPRPLS